MTTVMFICGIMKGCCLTYWKDCQLKIRMCGSNQPQHVTERILQHYLSVLYFSARIWKVLFLKSRLQLILIQCSTWVKVVLVVVLLLICVKLLRSWDHNEGQLPKWAWLDQEAWSKGAGSREVAFPPHPCSISWLNFCMTKGPEQVFSFITTVSLSLKLNTVQKQST